MSRIKQLALVLLIAALAAIGLAVASGTAGAATPTGTAYPPGSNCATLSIDKTVGRPGDTFTLTGANFVPGDHVTFQLQPLGTIVGSATADSNGAFTSTFQLPLNARGSQQVIIVGRDTICLPDPIQITVGTEPTATSTNPGGPGGTAFTGVKILELIFAAVALLGVGVLLTTSGRRRHRSAHHHR